jgi:hypothetical protein
MRIVVLGAGGMGSHAAKTAAGFDFIDEVVVADRDGAAAARLSEGSPKLRPATVDVTDESAMSQLLVAPPQCSTPSARASGSAVVDPERFFDRLARLCAPRRTGRGELLLLSRSWERRDLRAELRGPATPSATAAEPPR